MRIQYPASDLGNFSAISSVKSSCDRPKIVIWDEQSSRCQQVLEYVPFYIVSTLFRMKLKLRLSRIEEECSKFRRPSRRSTRKGIEQMTARSGPRVDRIIQERSSLHHCSVWGSRAAELLVERGEAEHDQNTDRVNIQHSADVGRKCASSRSTSPLSAEHAISSRLPTEKLILTENTN